MRYPEFLKENGRIGFIAPSFGCVTEPYQSCFLAALERFRSQGYETVLGPNCFKADGIGKSSSPENCAKEINDFFTDDKCGVLISCGGGETMCEDLSFVDFEAIAKSAPRWFMGYSDNTNLTFTLPTLCDTAAIYGPCASSFGARELHPAITDAFSVLMGKRLCQHSYKYWEIEGFDRESDPFAPINAVVPYSMRISNRGEDFAAPDDNITGFSGRLLGGCVDILTTLCGTRFDRVREFNEKYKDDGVVWFLECCDLDPIGFKRALWQLRSAGWFDAAKGFIFGRPYKYGQTAFGISFDDAIISALKDMKLPMIADADIGHLPPMMPVISGAMAFVSAGQDGLILDQRLE